MIFLFNFIYYKSIPLWASLSLYKLGPLIIALLYTCFALRRWKSYNLLIYLGQEFQISY